MITTGNRRADDDILLTRVARQEQLKPRQQSHIQRDAFRLTQRLKPIDEFARDDVSLHVAVAGLHYRTRTIGGNLK